MWRTPCSRDARGASHETPANPRRGRNESPQACRKRGADRSTDLALGLDIAGLTVATFATLGAMAGIGAGIAVGRLGLRRSLIGGMGAITLGNVMGAGAPDEFVLLAARITEGVGFLGVALAIPSMLARFVMGKARDVVMAAWSAYMPAGIMLMLLAAPVLPTIGWRNFWLANALAATACAILLAVCAPATPAMGREPAGRFLADVTTVVRRPSCLVLAFAGCGPVPCQ
jgi:MFS family permease